MMTKQKILWTPYTVYKREYKYDKKGNKVEEICKADDKDICIFYYKYDDKGNRIEFKTTYPDSTNNEINIWKYDDKNNMD